MNSICRPNAVSRFFQRHRRLRVALPSLILAGLAFQNFDHGWPILGWITAILSGMCFVAGGLALLESRTEAGPRTPEV